MYRIDKNVGYKHGLEDDKSLQYKILLPHEKNKISFSLFLLSFGELRLNFKWAFN
jgi:hypothetical protein